MAAVSYSKVLPANTPTQIISTDNNTASVTIDFLGNTSTAKLQMKLLSSTFNVPAEFSKAVKFNLIRKGYNLIPKLTGDLQTFPSDLTINGSKLISTANNTVINVSTGDLFDYDTKNYNFIVNLFKSNLSTLRQNWDSSKWIGVGHPYIANGTGYIMTNASPSTSGVMFANVPNLTATASAAANSTYFASISASLSIQTAMFPSGMTPGASVNPSPADSTTLVNKFVNDSNFPLGVSTPTRSCIFDVNGIFIVCSLTSSNQLVYACSTNPTDTTSWQGLSIATASAGVSTARIPDLSTARLFRDKSGNAYLVAKTTDASYYVVYSIYSVAGDATSVLLNAFASNISSSYAFIMTDEKGLIAVNTSLLTSTSYQATNTAGVYKMTSFTFTPIAPKVDTPLTNTPNRIAYNASKQDRGTTPAVDWAWKSIKSGADSYGTGDIYLCADGVYQVADDTSAVDLNGFGTRDNYIEFGVEVPPQSDTLSYSGVTLESNKSIWAISSSDINFTVFGYKE